MLETTAPAPKVVFDSPLTERQAPARLARLVELRVAAIRNCLARHEQLAWRRQLDENPQLALVTAEAVYEHWLRLAAGEEQLSLELAA